MPKKGERVERKPLPGDPMRVLSESLLAAEVRKLPSSLLIRFDEPSDARAAHKVLCGLQDNYAAERDP